MFSLVFDWNFSYCQVDPSGRWGLPSRSIIQVKNQDCPATILQSRKGIPCNFLRYHLRLAVKINRNPSPNPWVSQTHHVHPTPRLRSRSSPKGNKILVSLCIKTCNFHVSHVDHNTKYDLLLWLMCKSEKHRIVYSDSKEKHIVSYSQNSVFQNVVNQFPSKTNDQPFQISSANWQTFCAYSVPTPSSWCNQIHRHPNW